jgi:Alkyl hydroperoxide reductase, large subunit
MWNRSSLCWIACLSLIAGMFFPLRAFAARDGVNPSKGMTFGEFLATGSSENIAAVFSRLDSVELTLPVKSRISQIDRPILLVVYGSMSCPDCTIAVPILESMTRFNPFIEALYFERDLEAREMLFERTGLNRIPTIFVADPDGTLHAGAYIEQPRIVYDLLESSSSEEEKRAHIEAFRAGTYDAEVQDDLAQLLVAAIKR